MIKLKKIQLNSIIYLYPVIIIVYLGYMYFPEFIRPGIIVAGMLILVFSYPIYLLFCFVIWAIKTLKEKD